MEFTTTKGNGLDRLTVLVHGASGSGKTTLAATTGDPRGTLILSAEAGLLPLRHLDIRVKEIDTLATLREVYSYLARGDHGFSWVILDSISEIAERVLAEEKANVKDPRQAYGTMAETIYALVKRFRSLPLNVVVLAKQSIRQDDVGRMLFCPRFPGKQLGQGIAYEFDIVCAMRAERNQDGVLVRWLQTEPCGRFECKDRSGSLAANELPNLAALASKIKETA